METLTLVLFLAVAVLISAVLNQIIPRVSLPLIQIVMGVLIALFARTTIDVDLDPDLFLVLFIAPLLYLEAKDADKSLLWRNKGSILSLAIGLVIVSTLIIGFAVNALIPTIPLAAAFALGAALGPTDAVAVTSLSKQVSLPERQWGILKGELLLNDASGIVSFQFAIAAAATGVFSIFDASITFVAEFIGGLLFGLLLGYLANFVLRKIRDLGIESTTFHVLYEICIPFIVYLAANAIHVSGIIAVVVAGLVNVIAPRTVSPEIAHMNIVSSSVWQVLAFALNGIVFVMLGTQIPTSMHYTWLSEDISNAMVVVYVLLITAILLGVRFIWCVAMEYVHVKSLKERFDREALRKASIITLCGSKGTITLSILFTIPFYMSTGAVFPQRSLIIFLGCGVIICTLLIATYIVPLVSPKKERPKSEIEARNNYYEVLSDILRNVIEQLTAQQTPESRRSTGSVIQAYQDRLRDTKLQNDSDEEASIELRIKAFEWESERTLIMIEEGLVSKEVGLEYLARLDRLERYAKHRDDRNVFFRLYAAARLRLVTLKSLIKSRFLRKRLATDRQDEMRKLQLDTAKFAAKILRELVQSDDIQTESASQLLLFYQRRMSYLKQSSRSVTTSFKIIDEAEDVQRMAYQIELEQIQKMYEAGRIDRKEANRMRDNVFLMQMDINDNI